jgi:uncharacterized membrane-anchored protein
MVAGQYSQVFLDLAQDNYRPWLSWLLLVRHEVSWLTPLDIMKHSQLKLYVPHHVPICYRFCTNKVMMTLSTVFN